MDDCLLISDRNWFRLVQSLSLVNKYNVSIFLLFIGRIGLTNESFFGQLNLELLRMRNQSRDKL